MRNKQLRSDLAKDSLKKWLDDTAIVFTPCPFCHQTANISCKKCLCPSNLCYAHGRDGIFDKIVKEAKVRFNFSEWPNITMIQIDQSLRQAMIAGLQKCIIGFKRYPYNPLTQPIHLPTIEDIAVCGIFPSDFCIPDEAPLDQKPEANK